MVAHDIAKPDTVKNDSANDANAQVSVIDIMTGNNVDPVNLLDTGNAHAYDTFFRMQGDSSNESRLRNEVAFDSTGRAGNLQALGAMVDQAQDATTGSRETNFAAVSREDDAAEEATSNDDYITIVDAGDAQNDERWTEDEHLNLVAKDRDIVADPSMGVAGFLFALDDWNNDPSNEYIDPTLAEKIIQNNTDVGALYKLTDMLHNAGMPGVKEYGDNLMTQLANSGNQEAFEIQSGVARTMELEAQKAELALNDPENNNELNNPVPQQPVGMRL